jgi:hypothetical protein
MGWASPLENSGSVFEYRKFELSQASLTIICGWTYLGQPPQSFILFFKLDCWVARETPSLILGMNVSARMSGGLAHSLSSSDWFLLSFSRARVQVPHLHCTCSGISDVGYNTMPRHPTTTKTIFNVMTTITKHTIGYSQIGTIIREVCPCS